jgi:tetratricopeptide (TPR) repeat protein
VNEYYYFNTITIIIIIIIILIFRIITICIGIRDTSPVNESGEEFNPYSDFIKFENEIYDEIEQNYKNLKNVYVDEDADRHDGGYSNAPEKIVSVNDEDCHLKGYLLRKQGKFEEAIEEYSKALELHPGHFRTLFNRAFAYDKVGLIEKALLDYTAALGVDPNNAFAYYNRGISLDRLRRLEEAISDFTLAIQIHPECPDFYHNRYLCTYIYIYVYIYIYLLKCL